MNPSPFISMVMSVRDEARFIRRSLNAVLSQDYPKDRHEIIVAEGQSADGTRQIVESFQKRSGNLKIVDNLEGIASTGLNKAIRESKGDIIIRVDGHAEISTDYLRRCVEEFQKREASNIGGRMRPVGEGLFGEAVAVAMNSLFGTGGAQFHCSDHEGWVDTVYLGAWPRSLFEEVGYFDEGMVRNQDDEFNYRLLKYGKKIFLSQKLYSKYTVRENPYSLFKQYFNYGFWKVRVMQKHPQQMKLRQYIPPAFVGVVLGSFLLSVLFPVLGLISGLAFLTYGLANIVSSFWMASKKGWQYVWLLSLVYAILHVGYGLGFLFGLVKFAGQWRQIIEKEQV